MEEKPNGIVLQKKHVILIIALLLVLLGAAVFGVVYGISGRKGSGSGAGADAGNAAAVQAEQPKSDKPGIVIDKNAGDWTGELPENKGGDDGGGVGVGIQI